MSEVKGIEDLTPDPENARRHGARNIQMIEDAIRTVGPARSIVIDEKGVILAGNATTEAAKRAGIENVRVVDTDGTKLVVVRVTGLSETEKRHLALADNRAGELAEWDVVRVKTLFDAGIPVTDYWSGHELAALFQVGADPEQERADTLPLGSMGSSGVPTFWFGPWSLRVTREEEDRLRAVIKAWPSDELHLLGDRIANGGPEC